MSVIVRDVGEGASDDRNGRVGLSIGHVKDGGIGGDGRGRGRGRRVRVGRGRRSSGIEGERADVSECTLHQRHA